MESAEYERHMRRVTVSESGCFVWGGAVLGPHTHGGGGYAIADVGGKTRLLHRAMYEHANGPIPDGATLDHLCRVRNCVNPAHLEPVSSRENTLRGFGPSAENAVKTECPTGHPYDSANTWVDKTGRRHCRACMRARYQKWYAKNPDYHAKRRAKQ